MSKFILIEVCNQEIYEPDVYNSYDEAYAEMERRFNKVSEEAEENDCSICKDYASVQTICDNFDWRIYEVKI
jgi:hypothetical protein